MATIEMEFKDLKFDGAVYERSVDDKRLTRQFARIVNLMIDGEWRTLHQISETTGDPQTSTSAQLRHLRKKRFGAHKVNKRRNGVHCHGMWEYQLIWNGHDRKQSP